MPTPLIWIEDLSAETIINKGSIVLTEQSSNTPGNREFSFDNPFNSALDTRPAFNISFCIQGTINDIEQMVPRLPRNGHSIDVLFGLQFQRTQILRSGVFTIRYAPTVADHPDELPYLDFACLGPYLTLPDLSWLDGNKHYISYQSDSNGKFEIYQDGVPIIFDTDANPSLQRIVDSAGNVIYECSSNSSNEYAIELLNGLNLLDISTPYHYVEVNFTDLRFYTRTLSYNDIIKIIVGNDDKPPKTSRKAIKKLNIIKAIAALPETTTPDYFFDYFKWYHEITSANLPPNVVDVFKDSGTDVHHNQWGIVDLDSRTIIPPKTFGVSSDQRAEVIYFQMPRYYNGYDLSKATGIISYINAKGERHTYGIPFFDVITLNKEFISPEEAIDAAVYERIKQERQKVVFPWVVSSQVTAAAGDVKFNMSFFFVDNEGKLIFAVNTLSATSKVEQGIEIDPTISGLIDSLELPSIEELYELYKSIDFSERVIEWQETADEVIVSEPVLPIRDRVTIPE